MGRRPSLPGALRGRLIEVGIDRFDSYILHGFYSFGPKDSGRNRATERFTDRHLANENGFVLFLAWTEAMNIK